MAALDLILFEEDHDALHKSIIKLCAESESKAVFLIDKNGQQLTAAGEFEGLDTTSLASLTAGNVAATDGLAKLLGESGFTILFHEGKRDNIHISMVGDVAILVVIFDQRTSVGMVRLRVKQATVNLEEVLERAIRRQSEDRAQAGGKERPRLAEITDEDIENLFK